MGATWAAMAAAAAARSRVRVRRRSADFTTWASSQWPGVVDLGQNLDSLALEAAAADAYALGVAGGDASLAVVAAWRLRTAFLLCAFRPGCATTLRLTWVWTGTT